MSNEENKKFIEELKELCYKYNKCITIACDMSTGDALAVAFDLEFKTAISVDMDNDKELGEEVDL